MDYNTVLFRIFISTPIAIASIYSLLIVESNIFKDSYKEDYNRIEFIDSQDYILGHLGIFIILSSITNGAHYLN
jgi:hypothetical protein